MPIIARHHRDGVFPAHLVKPMAELGMLGGNIQGYGCAGLGSTAHGLIMQELERGDSGFRSFVSVQGALCMYPIYTYGSDAQKEKYLPRMAKGEVIGCFGLTEPDYGSNPGGMATTAHSATRGRQTSGRRTRAAPRSAAARGNARRGRPSSASGS